MATKERAPRNRTLVLTEDERKTYLNKLKKITAPVELSEIIDITICQDLFEILDFFPSQTFALVFADPPYNLTKNFNGTTFKQTDLEEYEKWLDSWLGKIQRLLKPDGSVYICGDWRSSAAIHRVLAKYFIVRNRITWEREKGRGARTNWKNNSEDIWFATMSDKYTFNVDSVKLKRKVLAPYTSSEGEPKDWHDTENGRYRITHPSNIWTDLTVPFWSMPENTDHPTQKPEKLLARLILASSNKGDIVFDPFVGSGTTSVVAKKLGRHYVGIEINADYCCIAEKRLALAEQNPDIQGYTDGIFWERNTLADQNNERKFLIAT
ncbi:MAG: site-specific DNA-methyltransferase [Sedimentisphaerales bacterium]|nr:site-specific DNA-methyltransferase [Sedimentisphaerales bacterium]